MKAMALERPGLALALVDCAAPRPAPGQIVVKVAACGVCRTDLHVCDGELSGAKLPLVLGHEIIGTVSSVGAGVTHLSPGMRVGVPWLGATCGLCEYCTSARENLCGEAQFTGYTLDGGYAEYTLARADFCFPIETTLSDVEAAPLMCAGLIGYRSLRFAGDAKKLGIYGFGAAAHIVTQIALHQGRRVFAFTRPGDTQAQQFARRLGAEWAGGSDELAPVMLDAAIIFAPVGRLVPAALRAVARGGTVVLGGIHMSTVPAMPYSVLWGERTLKSVANLTRSDAIEFLACLSKWDIKTEVEALPLSAANKALDRLRAGEVTGALVLVP